jgi:hypothetical protein
MTFNPNNCKTKSVFCGNGKIPKGEYSRKGTPYECLQKGFGAATFTERQKSLPKDSLQRIRYVGPLIEKKFKSKKITTTSALIKFVRGNSVNNIEQLLNYVLKKSNNTIDKKAYNAILLYLYQNGNNKLPVCKKI